MRDQNRKRDGHSSIAFDAFQKFASLQFAGTTTNLSISQNAIGVLYMGFVSSWTTQRLMVGRNIRPVMCCVASWIPRSSARR
jgi:hypothetical protein